ncbi:hypothetical protein BJV78DRAFT_1218911 [Lactifluus subvellereus]|nr:hypothetical protein BJV78DRAFT_1218911 [Lactifluus subvellereus]
MWLSGFLLIHGGTYALTTDPAKEIYSSLGSGPRLSFHRGSQLDGLDDVWSRSPSPCADTWSRYPTFPILSRSNLAREHFARGLSHPR